MKTKKPKKAVWKGWGIKNIHTGNFSKIYGMSPELNLLKAILENEVTPDEKVVEVEVREV